MNPKIEEILKALRFEAGIYVGSSTSLVCEAAADLIEQLHQELIDERYRHDRYADFCVAQGETLSKLRARQRWIPVTESLPKEDGKCLVTCGAFGATWTRVLCFAEVGEDVDAYDLRGKRNVWYEYDSEYGYIDSTSVTHWMPLPEPPKE